MKNQSPAVSSAAKNFPLLPDVALVGLVEYRALTSRSKSSFYRAIDEGKLTVIKLGRSTRVRVGELRALMGISGEVAA